MPSWSSLPTDEGIRAGRTIPLKKNVDDALKNPGVTTIEHVVVLKRTGGSIGWEEGRDRWWHTLIEQAGSDHQPVTMNAEDPLFILYTSGSTGKPKGVLHTTGGYLVYAATTFKYVFDYHPGEIYWCTADVGWITGHSYLLYGPNVSGHRLGTAEIESALVSYPKIAEAAVVGIPHNIKGQAIYAYVTLNHGEDTSAEPYAEVRNWRPGISATLVIRQPSPIPASWKNCSKRNRPLPCLPDRTLERHRLLPMTL